MERLFNGMSRSFHGIRAILLFGQPLPPVFASVEPKYGSVFYL
jgi:aminoglycoside phosphotransferase (APT) family kinase protein